MLIVLLSCRRNEPPTCIITHPSHNAVFTVGASIPISVNADDPDGTVLEVRLFFDNIGIVTMANFPFNFELNTDEYDVGNYTLKATVTDNSGLEASDEIQITIDADLPSVTTGEISEITASSATCGGYVVSDGGSSVTARGVCWSTSQNPTLSDIFTTDGNGTGNFTSLITELSCETTYYVRAYATNSSGTAYGSQVNFTTSSCPVRLPTVTTSSVSSITENSAISGGNVTDDGGGSVTSKGVCWSTSQNPTLSDNNTNDGTGTGSFTSSLTGLMSNTTYYVRSYATNIVGTQYGPEVSFQTLAISVTDFDGNIYQTVTIGDQVWMAENLKVTHYSDGSVILLVVDNSDWDALSYADKAYCWYDNNPTNGDTYGALYNWAGAMNGTSSSDTNPSGAQGVCPAGWHLPSDTEWTELIDYLGGDKIAAGKLKETGIKHWDSPNTGATNESGFTALPGGYRFYGSFYDAGGYANFWTATESSDSSAWSQLFFYDSTGLQHVVAEKRGGLSVRCVKN